MASQGLAALQAASMSMVVTGGFLLGVHTWRTPTTPMRAHVAICYLIGSGGWIVYGALASNFFLATSASINAAIYLATLLAVCRRAVAGPPLPRTPPSSFSDSETSLLSFPPLRDD